MVDDASVYYPDLGGNGKGVVDLQPGIDPLVTPFFSPDHNFIVNGNAGRTVRERFAETINVLDFIEATDLDHTNAMIRASIFAYEQGYGHIHFPNIGEDYIFGIADILSLPTAMQAALAYIVFSYPVLVPPVNSPYLKPVGMCMVGLRGGAITADRGVVIKRKDLSATTSTYSGASWGIFNFFDCQDIEVTGLTINGNWQGQTHTAIYPNHCANHGLVFDHYCKRVEIYSNYIYDVGTQLGGYTGGGFFDTQGDCVYTRSGIEDFRIHNNKFKNFRRSGVTNEHPFPTSTLIGTKRLFIYNNIFESGFPEDTSPPSTSTTAFAVDIETGNEDEDVRIFNNLIKGTGRITHGGGNTALLPTVVDAIGYHVIGNVWDFRGSTNLATANTDNFITLAGDWGVAAPTTPTKRRRFLNAVIKDNVIITDKAINSMVILQEAVFKDIIVSNNRLVSVGTIANTTDAMVLTSEACFQGTSIIEGMHADQKGGIIRATSWRDSGEALPFRLIIRQNTCDLTLRAFVITGPTNRIPGTGTVSITNGSAVISGTSTQFLSELIVGGDIVVGAERMVIRTITSNTSATAIANSSTTSGAGASFTLPNGVIFMDNNKAMGETSPSTFAVTETVLKWGLGNTIRGAVPTFTGSLIITPGRSLASASMAVGTSSLVVPTYLLGTTTRASITPTSAANSTTNVRVSAKGAGTFTVTSDTNVAGSPFTFDWEAESMMGG